jgi:hypothetical protein
MFTSVDCTAHCFCVLLQNSASKFWFIKITWFGKGNRYAVTDKHPFWFPCSRQSGNVIYHLLVSSQHGLIVHGKTLLTLWRIKNAYTNEHFECLRTMYRSSGAILWDGSLLPGRFSTILWDGAPCSLAEFYLHFGRPYYLRLQNWRMSQFLWFLLACFLDGLLFNPDDMT